MTPSPLSPTHAPDSGSKASKRLLDIDDLETVDSEDLLPPPVAVEPDDVLWFDDGSVILEAGFICFRVHGSMLSYHSEVFRDLINDHPRPVKMVRIGPVEDSVGTMIVTHSEPVKIKLSDDPDELRHLLRIVLLGEPFYDASVQMPFASIAALIRLANKYQFRSILDEGLKRMKSCFTDCLLVYDVVERKKGSARMSFVESDAIAAVAIARLTNTPSILPLALYMCSQLDPDIITNGIARANGFVDRLSPADQLGCLRARAMLRDDVYVAAYNIVRPTCAHAFGVCVCAKTIKTTAQELWKYEDSALARHRALQNWDDIIDRVAGDLCPGCVSLLRRRTAKERRTIWEKLPKIFGVPYTLKA